MTKVRDPVSGLFICYVDLGDGTFAPKVVTENARARAATALGLLSNGAVSSSWIEVSGGGWQWSAWGTWGGAAAVLQWSPDEGATVIDLDVDVLTEDGAQIVAFGAGHIRVLITGGAGVSLTSDLRGL